VHVTALLQAKLDAVQARKQELDTLAREIEQLLRRARNLDAGDCTDNDICHILTAPR
jgi:hypothetical protein